MKSFSEVEKELGLKKFLQGSLGVLYFVPTSPGSKRVIVRRLDENYGKEFVQNYVNIIDKCAEVISQNEMISRLVFIEVPQEFGSDYILRKHYTYTTSTDCYEEEHNAPEYPEELVKVRKEVELYLSSLSLDENEGIVRSILTRSLINPSSKTFFNDIESKLVVVEPNILHSEVVSWK